MKVVKVAFYYGISLVPVKGHGSNLRGDYQPSEDYSNRSQHRYLFQGFFDDLFGLGNGDNDPSPDMVTDIVDSTIPSIVVVESLDNLSRNNGRYTDSSKEVVLFDETLDEVIEETNKDTSEFDEMEVANKKFVGKIFHPLVRKKSNAEAIVLSPAGIFFILALSENILQLPLYRYWSSIASNIDLVGFNNALAKNNTLVSKSIVAGKEWYQKVPGDFEMENFKAFDSVDVKHIEEYLGVSVSEIKNAKNAAVHYIQFTATWKTKFSGYSKVTFSDGVQYGFMKAKIANVPWYEDNKVQMITLPFSDLTSNIVIDFIQSGQKTDFVDMKDHSRWVAESKSIKNSYVVIPKVDIDFSTGLDLSYDSQIESLQKVKVTWNEDGVKAEAVTIVMTRSFQYTPWFIASRPFYFVIRKENTWLFTGYVDSIDGNLNPLPAQ